MKVRSCLLVLLLACDVGISPGQGQRQGIAQPSGKGEDAARIDEATLRLPWGKILHLFEPGDCVVENKSRQKRNYRYRLFQPTREGRETETFPLIVWLHGHGADELDYENHGQLKHLDALIFREPQRPEKYPFFLLAVQCPRELKYSWMPSDRQQQDSFHSPLEAVIEIIDGQLKDLPIDPDRVLLAGVSSGGTASWELAMRYPDRFAAVAPMAAHSLRADGRLSELVDVPIWEFYSAAYHRLSVPWTVSRLKELGGRCHLTGVPTNRHDCWTAAFRDYGLLRWLVAQERGSFSSPAPGSLDWTARGRILWRDGFASWLNADTLIPLATLATMIGLGTLAWRWARGC